MSRRIIGCHSKPVAPKFRRFVVTVRFEKAIHQELVSQRIFRTELNCTATFRYCALHIIPLCRNGEIQVGGRIIRVQFNGAVRFLDGFLVTT